MCFLRIEEMVWKTQRRRAIIKHFAVCNCSQATFFFLHNAQATIHLDYMLPYIKIILGLLNLRDEYLFLGFSPN